MANPAALVRRPRTGKQIIGRFLARSVAAIVLTVAAAYFVDYLILRLRVATNKQPYGTVTVHPYYAVPQKDRKTEFILGDPADQQCVHSLFPHMGDSPCWYLSSHTDQRINM
jgi:hypothetical protein